MPTTGDHAEAILCMAFLKLATFKREDRFRDMWTTPLIDLSDDTYCFGILGIDVLTHESLFQE